MSRLRLMSRNQWKCDKNQPAWEEKGMDCSGEHREKGFVRLYGETMPDIVGIQEISGKMAEYMMMGLADAGLADSLIWGKDTPILYRPDKFEVVHTEYLIYPEAIEGLEGSFNNHKTKSLCAAVLREKESGKLLCFISTHLWWKNEKVQAGSNEARAVQIKIAIGYADKLQKQYNCPAVIVGDLNAPYNSAPIKAALEAGFVHAHDVAVEYADPTAGYHWCGNDGYEPMRNEPFEKAIDHILVRGADEGFVRRFERYTPDYYLPLSDHSPVFADVEL